MSISEGNGKPVSGSWNKEVRADSSSIGVGKAAVAALGNCVVGAHSASLSVLSGMPLRVSRCG